VSAVETLRTLARGERPKAGLLHSCRLDAFGAEVYGEEAIVRTFRRGATAFADAAKVITAPGHIGIFDGETALVADLFDDQVARIWRLGDGVPTVAEPGVSVPFDPDLSQTRGNVLMAPSDHPALAADALPLIIQAGETITRVGVSDYRARAFLIRAFGTVEAGAALFAVYRLGGDGVLVSGFSMAAAHWAGSMVRLTTDRSGLAAVAERPWTPRVGR